MSVLNTPLCREQTKSLKVTGKRFHNQSDEPGPKREQAGTLKSTGDDPSEAETAYISVYDGQVKLGEVRMRGTGAEARLVDGTPIGIFPDRRTASSAIYSATRPAAG